MKRKAVFSAILSVLMCVSLLFSLVGCFSQPSTSAGGNKVNTDSNGGYNQGYIDGWNAAISKLNNNSDDDGYDQGYLDGWNASYNLGYDDGYSQGYDDGYDLGYEYGYEDGGYTNKNAGNDNGNDGNGDNTDTPTDPGESGDDDDPDLPKNNYDDVVQHPETEIFSDNFEGYGEDGAFVKEYYQKGGDLSEAYVSTDCIEGNYSISFSRTIGAERWAALYRDFDSKQNWEKQKYISFWAKGEGAMAVGVVTEKGSTRTDLVTMTPNWTFYSLDISNWGNKVVMSGVQGLYFTWSGATATNLVDDLRITEKEIKQYNAYIPVGDNANVIENGEYYDGDENGVPAAYTVLTDGSNSAASSVALDGTVKHSGSYAIKFTAKAETGKTQAGFVATLGAGKQVTNFNYVKLWLKGDGNGEQKVTVNLKQDASLVATAELAITGEWKEYKIPVTLPEGASSVSFGSISLTTAVGNADRVFYLDDFVLALKDGIQETPADVIENGEYYTSNYTVNDAYSANGGSVSLDADNKYSGNKSVKFDIPVSDGAEIPSETVPLEDGESYANTAALVGSWDDCKIIGEEGPVSLSIFGHNGGKAVSLNRYESNTSGYTMFTLDEAIDVLKGDTFSFWMLHNEKTAAQLKLVFYDAADKKLGTYEPGYLYNPDAPGKLWDKAPIGTNTWTQVDVPIDFGGTIAKVCFFHEHVGNKSSYLIDDISFVTAPHRATTNAEFTYSLQPKSLNQTQHFSLYLKGDGNADKQKLTIEVLDNSDVVICAKEFTVSGADWEQVYIGREAVGTRTVSSIRFTFPKDDTAATVWLDEFVILVPEQPPYSNDPNVIEDFESYNEFFHIGNIATIFKDEAGYDKLATVTVQSNVVRSGKNALCFDCAGFGGAGVWYAMVDYPYNGFAKVNKGDMVSVWIYQEPGEKPNDLRFSVYTDQGSVYCDVVKAVPGQWTEVKMSVNNVTGENATITGIRFFSTNLGGNSKMYIDDMTITRAQ